MPLRPLHPYVPIDPIETCSSLQWHLPLSVNPNPSHPCKSAGIPVDLKASTPRRLGFWAVGRRKTSSSEGFYKDSLRSKIRDLIARHWDCKGACLKKGSPFDVMRVSNTCFCPFCPTAPHAFSNAIIIQTKQSGQDQPNAAREVRLF